MHFIDFPLVLLSFEAFSTQIRVVRGSVPILWPYVAQVCFGCFFFEAFLLEDRGVFPQLNLLFSVLLQYGL